MSRVKLGVLALTFSLVGAALGGYLLFRRQTPVPIEAAVERFEDANDSTTSGTQRVGVARTKRQERPRSRSRGSRKDPAPTDTHAPPVPDARPDTEKETPREQGDGRPARKERSTPLVVSVPAEGVYTYDGRGHEGFGFVTREFPSTSRRIITHEGDNVWLEHHIFSEERQAWSRIGTSETGRLAYSQRNYIRILTHEEDETLAFDPPIPTAMLPPKVGDAWSGSARGETQEGRRFQATYRCRTFDEKVFTLQGVHVRTWGVLVELEFEGEVNGTVTINRWFSPSYGLNVQEDYSADVDLGPVTYHGEWSVTLRSITPVS